MLASAPPGQVEDTSKAMFSHNLHNTSSSSGFRHKERHLNGVALRVNETNEINALKAEEQPNRNIGRKSK